MDENDQRQSNSRLDDSIEDFIPHKRQLIFPEDADKNLSD
jgi:hypothetical protein